MTQYVTCERCGTMWEFMQHYVGPQQCPACAEQGRGIRRAGTGAPIPITVPGHVQVYPPHIVEDNLALGRERDALRAKVKELEERIRNMEPKP